MSRNMKKHFANCADCGSFDETGCLKSIRWVSGPVPSGAHCYEPILYRHPDGEGRLVFNPKLGCLMAENENIGICIYLPVGPLGLIDIGQKLVALGLEKINTCE